MVSKQESISIALLVDEINELIRLVRDEYRSVSNWQRPDITQLVRLNNLRRKLGDDAPIF